MTEKEKEPENPIVDSLFLLRESYGHLVNAINSDNPQKLHDAQENYLKAMNQFTRAKINSFDSEIAQRVRSEFNKLQEGLENKIRDIKPKEKTPERLMREEKIDQIFKDVNLMTWVNYIINNQNEIMELIKEKEAELKTPEGKAALKQLKKSDIGKTPVGKFMLQVFYLPKYIKAAKWAAGIITLGVLAVGGLTGYRVYLERNASEQGMSGEISILQQNESKRTERIGKLEKKFSEYPTKKELDKSIEKVTGEYTEGIANARKSANNYTDGQIAEKMGNLSTIEGIAKDANSNSATAVNLVNELQKKSDDFDKALKDLEQRYTGFQKASAEEKDKFIQDYSNLKKEYDESISKLKEGYGKKEKLINDKMNVLKAEYDNLTIRVHKLEDFPKTFKFVDKD